MQLRTDNLTSRLKYVVALMASLLLVALTPLDAKAIGIGESGFYSMSGSSCPSNGHVDPVGALFYGSQGHSANVASQIAIHAGWNHGSAGDQWLWVHLGAGNYGCRQTNHHRADHADVPPSGRFHIRQWFVPATQGSSVKKTVGTPHHEDFVWTCAPPSHAVDKNGSQGSGFDQGRHELKQAFIAGNHNVTSEYWGNTANFHQCDGDWAGSDGWGIRVPVNH
jgi:hypothetical protein